MKGSSSDMQLTLPTAWSLSAEAIAACFLFIIMCAWISSKAYSRIMSELKAMREDMDAMKERNKLADQETLAVKAEQADQKTTVAVMAQKLISVEGTVGRIDNNMLELLHLARGSNGKGQ